jgi:hypothetical protein
MFPTYYSLRIDHVYLSLVLFTDSLAHVGDPAIWGFGSYMAIVTLMLAVPAPFQRTVLVSIILSTSDPPICDTAELLPGCRPRFDDNDRLCRAGCFHTITMHGASSDPLVDVQPSISRCC